MNEMVQLRFITKDLPVAQEVALILQFISSSKICPGIVIKEGENVAAMIPHIVGHYEDLSCNDTETKDVAFSANCQIISATQSFCSACSQLLKIDKNRKKRKQERTEIKPKANKRYLSKEELVDQLQQEQKKLKNAKAREEYWKGKFLSQSLEMEKEDHEDLSHMLQYVKKENIPEDMECLLSQQHKILSTSSKHGYRWHPK